MNTQLIPTFLGHLNNENQPLVNARDLHEFLSVGRDFSNWLKNRINDYDFVENVDFIRSPNLASRENQGLMGFFGGYNKVDYHLSLDMAKELRMLERNEKGKQARRYFIEMEKQAKQRYSEDLIDELQDEYCKANPEMLKLVTYYRRGLSQREMAKLLDCTTGTIRERLKILTRLQFIDYQPNAKFQAMGRKGLAMLKQKQSFLAAQQSLGLEE